ncbi:O-acyltransferase WSD1 [Morus notabilis]|uniref:O-acyltransferase WSD1 n=3 Tax=Morus notabilis TaxID=981085 RepID=W9SFF4_9ROSA|nr:O-acyltransferase WSD1 [Morus notabilis]
MKWVRTKVDLDKHVIVADIDSNYTESPDKFLEDYIYNLTKTSLNKLKPMWDLHILNVKTSNAESVLILRVHHSLGDGISLMSLLLACSRQIANPQALPTLPTKKNLENNNNPSFIRRFTLRFIGLWWLLQLLWNTIVDVSLFIASAFFLKDTKTPIRAPPGCEYNPRRIVFRIVSLDDFKLVKNAMKLTINDVALGVTQAGLSRYLNRRYGENRDDGLGSNVHRNNLPKKIRLRANLLVNVRPSPGIQDLADMMEKNSEAKWGNWLGYVFVPFTIALKDDPLDYIRDAKATIDRKKHSLEALCTFSISGLLFSLFGIKSTTALLHRIFSSTTMAFSNVVGPSEEIAFYNHSMTYLAATTYGQPNELMVNFQSYVNKMTMVLSVDETTIPDPLQLCDDIAESLKLIKDVVIERGLANIH